MHLLCSLEIDLLPPTPLAINLLSSYSVLTPSRASALTVYSRSIFFSVSVHFGAGSLTPTRIFVIYHCVDIFEVFDSAWDFAFSTFFFLALFGRHSDLLRSHCFRITLADLMKSAKEFRKDSFLALFCRSFHQLSFCFFPFFFQLLSLC